MRGFPASEHRERISKLQINMQDNRLDAILVTSPHNFRYFTGLDTYFWESPTRPWFLLIPQNSDPIAIIPSIGKSALEKTWIENIQTWPSPQPNDEGLTALKTVIIKTLPRKSNIGCELGFESHLRMSINDFDKLIDNLINYKFLNASDIIWKIRAIKSKNEITKIRQIITIASKVFDKFQEKLHVGMTEIEICNIFKKELIDKGADHTLYMSCASGQGGYNQIICNPSEKKIINGDILIIDTGSTFDGYFCDFDRNYGFGKISKESKDAYTVLWEATEKGLENASPGSTCQDISNAMLSVLNKFGLTSNNVGRMGHGLGLQLTEPPSIMPNDTTILKENMIMTIEPCFEYTTGKMLVHEENILITKNGYERLTTRTPKTIPIIS